MSIRCVTRSVKRQFVSQALIRTDMHALCSRQHLQRSAVHTFFTEFCKRSTLDTFENQSRPTINRNLHKLVTPGTPHSSIPHYSSSRTLSNVGIFSELRGNVERQRSALNKFQTRFRNHGERQREGEATHLPFRFSRMMLRDAYVLNECAEIASDVTPHRT